MLGGDQRALSSGQWAVIRRPRLPSGQRGLVSGEWPVGLDGGWRIEHGG